MGYASGRKPYTKLPQQGIVDSAWPQSARGNFLVLNDQPVALAPLLGADDPVWEEAVRAVAAELLASYRAYVADLAEYKSAWRFANEGYAGVPELARVAALMQLAKVVSYPPLIRRLHEVAGDRPVQTVEVPRDYVLTLDRGFRLACTCRYGHLACHHITGHDITTITRQCTECAPPTSWKEHRDA